MYVGARVEMKDGSLRGTITSIPAPNFWSIMWDDGESGAVHPLDVRFLGSGDGTELEACRRELVDRLIAEFGEFKKVIRMTTGEAFKVPIRDIIEKGIREQNLDKYPRWED